jgi:hypothetical protein
MTKLNTALTGSPLQQALRELDHRRNDGIDVRMLWNSRTNGVHVSVADERSGHSFWLDVDAADALEAFNHPYAYACSKRIDTGDAVAASAIETR